MFSPFLKSTFMQKGLVLIGVGSLLVAGIVLMMDEPQRLLAQDGPSATEEPSDPTPVATEEAESADVPDPFSDDPVERGRYLVMVAGACQDCHVTASEENQVFSEPLNVTLGGGLVFEFLPWGTVYAPNLTALSEWSDEEIEQAIRYGVRPDGSPLLPPMPYEAYANLSDEDMTAIIAYLRSLEPVESDIPDAEIAEDGTREDIRSVPDFDPEAEFPAPDFSEPLERGGYLVTTVSACVRCHGAVTEDGQLDPSGPLLGQVPLYANFGEFNAPTLTAEQLSELTDEQIRTVLIEGVNPDGEPIFFMPSHIFTNLTDDDVGAIINWLREGQPTAEDAPNDAG